MKKILRLWFWSLCFISAGCANYTQQAELVKSEEVSTETQSGFEVPVPNINLSNPLVVSNRPEDVSLCSEINQQIDKSPFANAHWGVMAVSLRDGRIVCSRDGRKLFNPASIQKTLISIVALDKLGADYRWKTSLLASRPVEPDGTLNGDLVLRGEGAPDFDNAALENLIDQLQSRGIRRITGNIIGDSSYFRGETIGAGWTWNELQQYYGAEASALTFNNNQAFVNVENGVGTPSTDYIRVTIGQPEPIREASNLSNNQPSYEPAGVRRGLEDNDFYIWGTSKSFGVRVAIHDSALWAAKSLRDGLAKKGIVIDGTAKSRDWKAEDGHETSGLSLLASVESKTLGEIGRKMNKNSVNLYAELILRTLGKKFGAEVPDNIQIPENVRGDDTAGAAVIKKWLMEKRIAADEIQISDGSGLSRLDFVTPETFAKAFIIAARSPSAAVFTDSLPVAATDGTLGGRLQLAKGQVLAKTGTVTFVNSLAGYAQNKSGEVFAFAIIVNNDTHKSAAVGIIDRLVLKLIGVSPEDQTENGLKNKSNQNTNVNANVNTNEPNFVIKSTR